MQILLWSKESDGGRQTALGLGNLRRHSQLRLLFPPHWERRIQRLGHPAPEGFVSIVCSREQAVSPAWRFPLCICWALILQRPLPWGGNCSQTGQTAPTYFRWVLRRRQILQASKLPHQQIVWQAPSLTSCQRNANVREVGGCGGVLSYVEVPNFCTISRNSSSTTPFLSPSPSGRDQPALCHLHCPPVPVLPLCNHSAGASAPQQMHMQSSSCDGGKIGHSPILS